MYKTHDSRNNEVGGEIKSASHRHKRANMRLDTEPDENRSINTL